MTHRASAPAKRRPRLPALGPSLRVQVALVIAGLSLLPNIVMALLVLAPMARRGDELVARMWLPLAAWMLVVAALSVLIGYALSRQLLLPLTRMGREIEDLQRGAQRASAARLGAAKDDPDEVVALKSSFNALLAQVQLEQARRGSFMATLVHDLKTPLIAGNHLLEVIRDNDALPRDERITIVSRLAEENRNLIELVQQMVDAYKFEREDVPLARERQELAPLVRKVMDRVAPLAKERGIAVQLRGEAAASIDARELERALYNLLGNAVRYAKSAISIDLYQGLVRLADDGPGLPAPLESLAQPFNAQPIELAGKRYTAGTGGLGLFIARRIVEAHGGRLVTETRGPGGTVLLIYLGAP